jgi:hypothetical protein
MLTPLDDSLWHQLPTTFDHAGTSDPRFFDRWWFACYDPAGSAGVQVTMGMYKNMNVLDGGVMVLQGVRQHNLRVSRSLRPDFEPAVGPLRVEVEVGVGGDSLVVGARDDGIALDLVWSAILPPEEEHPHFARVRGRVTEDYHRFDQVGVVSGTIRTPDGEIRADHWWGGRDHSWGVRPSAGIPEPVTGPAPAPGTAPGFLFAFLFFSTHDWAGHVQLAERGDDQVYLTGILRRRSRPDQDRRVVHASLRPTFAPGTRRVAAAAFALVLDDGEALTLEATATGASFAMPGLGYSGGWRDRQGLGVWRGDLVVEHETWDVADAADVRVQDGSVERPAHRIAPVQVAVGDDRGSGSLTLVATGSLPRFGLTDT